MNDDILPDLDSLPVEARDDLPVELPTEPWTEYNEHTHTLTTFIPLGDGRIIKKTEYLATQELLDDNHDRRMASQNRGWGDGAVFGSVPLNVYFNDPVLKAAREARDYARIERWFRDPDNAKWRTRDKI